MTPRASPQAHENFDPAVLADMAGLSRPQLYDDAPEHTRQQIVQEQATGLFAVTLYAAFFNIVISLLTVGALWQSVPRGPLLGWAGAIVALSLVRHGICRRFFKALPGPSALPRWLRILWLNTAAIGMGWSVLALVVWPADDMAVYVFACVLLTATVFATYGSLGIYKTYYIGFALPPCLGLAALLYRTASGWELGVALATLAVFMYGSAYTSLNATRIWRSTFVLVHRHHDLARKHRENSAMLATTLQSIGDGVLTVDRQGCITYLNPAAERLTGLAMQDLADKSLAQAFQIQDDASGGGAVDMEQLFRDARSAFQVPGELVLTSIRVSAISVDVTISPLHYAPGADPAGFVVTVRDVTSQRLLARDLSHQALHDTLTELLNRRGFEARLSEAIHRRLGHTHPSSLCLIDLDRFKAVNDTCGHQAGDLLLQQIVGVMRNCIRDSDTFARLGGDEFALLFHGCSIDKARDIAQGICEAVAAYRFTWDDKTFSVGTSIGVAPIRPNDTLDAVVEAADKACYRAKSEGRGRVCVDYRESPPDSAAA